MNFSDISEKNKYWISACCLLFMIYSTRYIVQGNLNIRDIIGGMWLGVT